MLNAVLTQNCKLIRYRLANFENDRISLTAENTFALNSQTLEVP